MEATTDAPVDPRQARFREAVAGLASRARSGDLLRSVDPLLRVGPVIVVLLGTTIMDPARFRFPTPTPIESPLGCFERVSSMEHPEVAEGWFCVTSGRGCFYRDERHCRRGGH